MYAHLSVQCHPQSVASNTFPQFTLKTTLNPLATTFQHAATAKLKYYVGTVGRHPVFVSYLLVEHGKREHWATWKQGTQQSSKLGNKVLSKVVQWYYSQEYDMPIL